MATSSPIGGGGTGDDIAAAGETFGEADSFRGDALFGLDPLGDPPETGRAGDVDDPSLPPITSDMPGLERTFLAIPEATDAGERSLSKAISFVGVDIFLGASVGPPSADLDGRSLLVSGSETSSLKGSSIRAGSGVPGEGDLESCPGRLKKRGLFIELELLSLSCPLILLGRARLMIAAH